MFDLFFYSGRSPGQSLYVRIVLCLSVFYSGKSPPQSLFVRVVLCLSVCKKEVVCLAPAFVKKCKHCHINLVTFL
jgi:hypothetical protein